MILARACLCPGSSAQKTNRPKSGGRSLFLVLGMALIIGCASQEKKDDAPLVDEKYSLKKDREAFEQLRKDIPEDVRRDNDEKAFMAELTADLSRHPSEVRSQFSRIINKKRELFGKDMNRTREKFNEELKKTREEFSRQQSKARSNFSGAKKSSQERTDFYNRLDAERREFNSEQQSKRDDFEADMRERRKNFDDYMRAKTDEFNQLHRDYTKRYEEDKKARANIQKLAEEKKRQQQKDIDTEYDPIRKKPATYLETTEGQ